MSEEDVKLETEEVPAVAEEAQVESPQVQEEVEVPKLTAAEQAAVEQGWKPPSEFTEEDKEPLSAEEFMRRGELFGKINDLKQQYKRDTSRLSSEVQELKALVKDERTRGYEQALIDLDSKRQEAVEMADMEAFRAIDTEYNRVRDQKAQAEAMQVDPAPQAESAEALSFVDKNSDWFNTNSPENSIMRDQAIKIEEHLIGAMPYLTESQKLDQVEEQIKKLYPHRFSNSKKEMPAKVEAPSAEAPSPSDSKSVTKLKFSDLDDRQKEACERFLAVDSSVTVEDYLNSVQEGMRIRHQL
jgi:hypothetical protein